MPRVSVSTVAFDGYPLDITLGAIAACGARFAELAYIRGYGDFDETAFSASAAAGARAALADAGLSSVAVSAHLDPGVAGAVEQLRRRIAFVRGIGAQILITNAGRHEAATAVMRTIEAVLPDCVEAGVVLALENPGHGTGALFGRAIDGVSLAEAFASPHVGLNYDYGNIHSYSRGAVRPDQDAVVALPVMRHVHVKDVRTDGEDWRFVAIGNGEVDCVALARLLATKGADIPVGLELPLRLWRPGKGDPVRGAAPIPLDEAKEAVRTSIERWNAWSTNPEE